VYQGLLQTFKNAGYQDSGPQKNLFLFTYNWTKSVNQIAEDLKNFIQNTVRPQPEQKILLVGHSLGGLTSRTYVQNNPQNPVGKLLTLGSPHKGAVQVYYAWEGGDLHFMNLLERIAVGLLLNFRRQGFATDKETIQNIAPVLKDLLPTFNYLKQDSTEIDYSTMNEKNNWLIALNNNPPPHLFANFTALLSNIPQSTPRWINIQPRNWLESILNLWPDGRPIGEAILDTGDKTVLSQSAQLNGAQVVELNSLGHREIVQTPTGQEKIMEILGLRPTSFSVSEDISEPVLVFLLASPATIEVFNSQGNPVGEGDERLKIITSAAQDTYQIKITGTGSGIYHLYLGQLTQTGDFWSEISGQINAGETQTREINFQPSAPLENPLVDPGGSISSSSARQKIQELKEYVNNKVPSPWAKRTLLAQINSAFRLLDKNKYEQVISSLYELHFFVARLQKEQKIPNDLAQTIKNKIEEIIAELEEVYVKTNSSPYPQNKLSKEIHQAEILFGKMEQKLKNLQNQSKATPADGALYLLAQEKLNKAKTSISHKGHINALGTKYLSLEGLTFLK
ncbi:MAG: esterase/lipase family protein, partial [Microgenomates group bacterium]